MNRDKGADPRSAEAPIQQQWFPGTHGSVGGGGDERGLSDAALAWVIKGACAQGLELDTRRSSRVYEFRPNYKAPLINNSAGLDFMSRYFPKRDREGPAELHEVHVSTRRRWLEPAENLPEAKPYRPPSLARVQTALDQLQSLRHRAYDGPRIALHTVVRGETLGKIASTYYGDALLFPHIFEANRHLLDDPDTIYVGDELVIPTLTVADKEPSS